MKVIKDLIGGQKPATLEMLYNGTYNADGVTKRYRGSLCKVEEATDFANGIFVTFANQSTTAWKNICGILEEEQGITGNYLLNDGTYAARYRKITPCFPSTVIQAEYSYKDLAGGNNFDTNASASAGGTTFTCGDALTADDWMIGGWLYMYDGAAAGELRYVTDQSNSSDYFTTSAWTNAIVAADDYLVIRPPMATFLLPDATGTGLMSVSIYDDVDAGVAVCGLSTWISSPGWPMQKLDHVKHDGLVLTPGTAKFFHQFTLTLGSTVKNFWLNWAV